MPAMPSITFSVNGEPGPSVLSVLQLPGVQIDGGYDHVMDGHGWRMMQYAIDVGYLRLPYCYTLLTMNMSLTPQWPGMPLLVERMRVYEKDGTPITRGMVAQEICARLVENMKRYPNVVNIPFSYLPFNSSFPPTLGRHH